MVRSGQVQVHVVVFRLAESKPKKVLLIENTPHWNEVTRKN